MTKAKADTRYHRSYIVPSILFIFGLLVSFSLTSGLVISGAYLSLVNILTPLIPALATIGLGLLCYTGLRSGKKIQDLPKGIVWFGWASMVAMILVVLEAILIFLMTSPIFRAQ